MPNERIQRVVEELNRYFNLSTKEDLIAFELMGGHPATVARGGDAPSPNSTALGALASNIVSVAEGGLTMPEVISRLERFVSGRATDADGGAVPPTANSDIAKFIEITTKGRTGSTLEAVNRIDLADIIGAQAAGQSTAELSIVQVKSANLLPAGRDNNIVTLFMNAIPTIELSRCVPFLEIHTQVGRSPFDSKNRVQGMSLAKFLEGSFTAQADVDQKMLTALKGQTVTATNAGSEQIDTTVASMELFTSPQTLVNPDPTLNANRAAPVIDPFRPFMSIDRFTAEIAPHVGFFAYYTADLDLTLYDRSRLAEIADFVRPDLYSNTELLVEYGWSHPDTTGNNSFGQLLNLMRVKQKFRVVNCSFSFQPGGQVKLKLKLATKGAADTNTIRITDGDDKIAALDAVRQIQKRIADLTRQVQLKQIDTIKEVRGEQTLFSMAEDLSSTLSPTPEQRKQLWSFVNTRRKGESGDTQELRGLLRELFGPRGDGRGGVASDFKTALVEVINKRVAALSENKDTFLVPVTEKIDPRYSELSKRNVPYVSLGKLFGLFVGSPLLASGNYTDVQLLFYPFNQRAGLARDTNISSFAININEFRRSLNAVAQARRGLAIPLREFMQFIFNNFVDDMGSINYGLKGVYTTEIDPATGVRRLKESQKTKDTTRLFNEQEAILRRIDPDGNGVFRMPVIDVLIETVPGAVVETNETQAAKNEPTILRIHVFDKTATRYEALGDLLRAARDDTYRTFSSKAKETPGKTADFPKHYQAFIDGMEDAGILSREQGTEGLNEVFTIEKGVGAIKEFISRNMPTLVYGTNGSAIIDGSLTTIQEQLLSTVHMLRAGDAGPLSPTGLSPGNLPLQTLPATVSLRTWGCPLVHYMQQFFIDFGTNTTIDNIYGVNKFTHELTSGKFESKWELVPLDAYGEYKSLAHHVGAALRMLEGVQKAQRT